MRRGLPKTLEAFRIHMNQIKNNRKILNTIINATYSLFYLILCYPSLWSSRNENALCVGCRKLGSAVQVIFLDRASSKIICSCLIASNPSPWSSHSGSALRDGLRNLGSAVQVIFLDRASR